MADGHGGYRKPSTPAPVSGPGAHSQRTDGAPRMDLPDAKYGEAGDFQAIQSGAPMGGQAAPAGPSGGGGGGMQPPTPLDAPSGDPSQPVTAGADAGAGPGFDALGLPNPTDEKADLQRRYGPYLPLLIRRADEPTASAEFRSQVRYLLSVIQ